MATQDIMIKDKKEMNIVTISKPIKSIAHLLFYPFGKINW